MTQLEVEAPIGELIDVIDSLIDTYRTAQKRSGKGWRFLERAAAKGLVEMSADLSDHRYYTNDFPTAIACGCRACKGRSDA